MTHYVAVLFQLQPSNLSFYQAQVAWHTILVLDPELRGIRHKEVGETLATLAVLLTQRIYSGKMWFL